MQPFHPCDYNTFLGTWPFRNLGERENVGALLEEMQACKVAMAYVSPLASLFESDPYPGGKWLISLLHQHSILIPAPIANPSLTHSCTAWKGLEELAQERLDTVRLAPSISGFPLLDTATVEFIRRAAIRRVLITLRMKDARQGHPTCHLKEEPFENALGLAAELPEVEFIVNGVRTTEVKPWLTQLRERSNVRIDVTFVDGDQGIEGIVEQLGLERLVLGSGYPILYTHAAMLKLRLAGIDLPNVK